MDNLEPITREETLLDGGDLTPITRKEMFIKRIYDKTQSVPEPITREEYFLAKAGEGSGGDVTIEQLNVTENGTYSESGKAYSPVVVNVPTPPIPENAYLLNSLSGLPAEIASFNDGTDLPMASLKVAVTPYQDLHGYDAPWAGGAGKNKFGGITTVLNAYINSGGTITSANNNRTVICKVNPSTQYTVSFVRSGISGADDWQVGEYGSMPQIGSTGTRVIAEGMATSGTKTSGTITTASTTEYLAIKISNVDNTNFDNTVKTLQVELGSTATTFAPYSNICPIIGWDEAVVTRCGKNLFDESTATNNKYWNNEGEQNGNFYAHSDYIKVKPSTTYYTNANTTGYIYCVVLFDANKNNKGTKSVTTGAFTTDSDTAYAIINTVKSLTSINDMYVVEGSTATTYSPYNGATYTIDLDGTRYGGVVDVLNGTMDDTLDHIASYNGEALPSTWISDRDVYAEGTTPTIGAEVVYTRATPITVQLAPTPVKSLEGENNICADCGQITEVKYFKKA